MIHFESLHFFVYKGKKYDFDPSILLKIDTEPDWIKIECKELDIIAGGASEVEAMEDFKDEVEILWNLYVERSWENFDESAKNLRRKLLQRLEVSPV